MLLDSMSVMPNVNSLIGAEGVTYQKHYCTVAWCCPSRVNFFTGRAAHNTNVTSTGMCTAGQNPFSKPQTAMPPPHASCFDRNLRCLSKTSANLPTLLFSGPPYGGWQKFTKEGLNEKYLPVWINDAGIRTYVPPQTDRPFSANLFKHEHIFTQLSHHLCCLYM